MKYLSRFNESFKINEDITSGSVIVYHRTGKNGVSPVKGIAADGFRVGSGDAYGAGVYTTYNLKSQMTDYMKTYGNILIECKVLSMDKFLIFDYDVAKKIYGNKNYTLDNQLRLILGSEWKNYKDSERFQKLLNTIKDRRSTRANQITSNLAESIIEFQKGSLLGKIRGIVFTGRRDGNVLVS